MPPVLDVALGELTCRSAQQMFARDGSFGDGERHAVLELIAETVCAAQLVKRRARPDSARESLIEQPAIQQDIHAGIWRRDLYCPQDFIPLPRDVSNDFIEIGAAITGYQLARAFLVFSLTQEKYHFGAVAGTQFDNRLQRGARIETRAHFPRELRAALQGGRTFRSSIAAEKFSAVSCNRSLPSGQIRKCNAAAKLTIPRATREQGARLRIEFGNNIRRGSATRIAQHPFGIRGNGDPACTARLITQRESRDFYRVFGRHKLKQIQRNTARAVLEAGISLPVAGNVGRVFIPDR